MSLPTSVTEDILQIKPCQKFEGHTNLVNRVIHLPGGQRIMTCSGDGSLRVWNLQTGQQIANWQDGESAMWTISLSVDGKKVVSGSEDGMVRLWGIKTGKVITRWTGHWKPPRRKHSETNRGNVKEPINCGEKADNATGVSLPLIYMNQ